MTAFLFPGQGSQVPGMGRDFFEHSDTARPVFDEARSNFGESFLRTLFDGDLDDVTDTRMAQPGLITVGVAIAWHLAGRGIEPSVCAGHSVGEFAALVVSGALSLEDALRLVKERARLMAEEAPEGAMAAVIGMDVDTIEDNLPDDVDVANYNGPAQTIISGAPDAIQRAIDQLKQAGAKRLLPLNVSGAFHSRLMTAAAEKFGAILDDIVLKKPKTRFASTVSADFESDPGRIRALLAKQMAAPVRWTETMVAIGEVDALELGPGTVLQSLCKRIPGAPKVRAAGDLEVANKLEIHN